MSRRREHTRFRYVNIVRAKNGKLRSWKAHDRLAREQQNKDQGTPMGRHTIGR